MLPVVHSSDAVSALVAKKECLNCSGPATPETDAKRGVCGKCYEFFKRLIRKGRLLARPNLTFAVLRLGSDCDPLEPVGHSFRPCRRSATFLAKVGKILQEIIPSESPEFRLVITTEN